LPEVSMSIRALLAFLTVLPFALAQPVLAQYPDHPVRMIVPQAAGSATDTLTRVLASALADELHQQIVPAAR
jgi:tripartite-type tricarboxylate transporter receptor subunit TctC